MILMLFVRSTKVHVRTLQLDNCIDRLISVNAPFQHLQVIQEQTQACYQDTMPYVYDRYLEIFSMYNHKHMHSNAQ